jgi:hypothetical protein
MTNADVLDTLLRLGREIREAAQNDDWARATDLVHRRTEAFQRMQSDGDQDGTFSGMDRRKLEALFAQNESLSELFRGRRNEIEDQLAELGDLRRAQSSYRENSTRSGALNRNLTG